MNADTPYTLRPLKPQDLEPVIEIDRRITGRSRRLFYEKRLEAALGSRDGFIAVAAECSGALTGFAIARIQNGEFGDDRRLAILDVIGIDPENRKSGQGSGLIGAIAQYLKKRGIGELRTQVDWADSDLIGFFAANGFKLASRQVLERATTRDI